jgi:hypothetical protein
MKRPGYVPNIEGAGFSQHEWGFGKKYVSSGEDSDWDDDKKYNQVKPFSGKGVKTDEKCFVVYDKF